MPARRRTGTGKPIAEETRPTADGRPDLRQVMRRLTMGAPRVAGRLREGDSVSVSGVCLTALAVNDKSFCADLAAETLARTSLSRMEPGKSVNIELAMASDGENRFGGHVVQGHV